MMEKRHAKERGSEILKARETPRSQPPARGFVSTQRSRRHAQPTQRTGTREWGREGRKQNSPFSPGPEEKFEPYGTWLLCSLLCHVFKKLYTKEAGHLEMKERNLTITGVGIERSWRP